MTAAPPERDVEPDRNDRPGSASPARQRRPGGNSGSGPATRDAEGLAWVELSGPGGQHVALWTDDAYPYIEIYTAHTQPVPHWRAGLGVEPMTCSPNAFRSGDGLIRLNPGESTRARWRLRAT